MAEPNGVRPTPALASVPFSTATAAGYDVSKPLVEDGIGPDGQAYRIRFVPRTKSIVLLRKGRPALVVNAKALAKGLIIAEREAARQAEGGGA